MTSSDPAKWSCRKCAGRDAEQLAPHMFDTQVYWRCRGCGTTVGSGRPLWIAMLFVIVGLLAIPIVSALTFNAGYHNLAQNAWAKGELKEFASVVALPVLGLIGGAVALLAGGSTLLRRVVSSAKPDPLPEFNPNAFRSRGFAIPPFLHVFLMFMTQFTATLFLVIPVMVLHKEGVNSVLLAIGAIAVLVGIHLLIAFLGRFVPVRCKHCRHSSHYRGLAWWPFVYRYDCKHCGQGMTFEVGG